MLWAALGFVAAVVATSTTQVPPVPPNLTEFSLWMIDAGDLVDVAGSINYAFDSIDATNVLPFSAAGAAGLFDLTHVLFDQDAQGKTFLRADYASRFQTFCGPGTSVPAMLANGTLKGFFMGDELIWGGVTTPVLTKAVQLVRRAYPNATIWENDSWCMPILNTDSWGNPVYFDRVPQGLSWWSIDYYPDVLGTTFANISAFYDAYVFPKVTPDQRLLYVPPSYSARTAEARQRYCGADDCEGVMIQWGTDAVNWAALHPNVIGFAPWHWRTLPSVEYEPGLSGLPKTKAFYLALGKAIVAQGAAARAR